MAFQYYRIQFFCVCDIIDAYFGFEWEKFTQKNSIATERQKDFDISKSIALKLVAFG